jgi:hypothetical protein
MISDQHSESTVWRLGPGQSMQLEIGPGRRHLRVCEGRLWLTAQGTPEEPAEDVWLVPGDDVVLGSGARLVAEGWPQASFELIVPPQATPDRAGQARPSQRNRSDDLAAKARLASRTTAQRACWQRSL